MKKITLDLLALSSALLLSACSLLGGNGNGGNYTNDNLSSLSPESIPDYVNQEDNQTYYSKDDVILSLECSGYFTNYTYFYLDENNNNLRIYDNLYFYEKDYFYFVSKDVRYLWASIEGTYDAAYLEEEKEQGQDVRINVLKDGIYTLKFNLETKKVNVTYKSEITEPKYFPVETADIYNGADKKFVSMTKSASNPDELEYKNLEVKSAKSIAIVNKLLHSVMFRLTPDPDSKAALITLLGEKDISFYSAFDGKINLYFNTKTYTLRAEIVDKEHSTFYIQTIGNTGVSELQVNDEHPYIFTCSYTTPQYDRAVPDFYGNHVNKLNFNYSEDTIELYEYTYKDEPRSYYRFKEEGTYNFTIDMSTLDFTATKVA